jgi:hypothetical protein
MSEFGEAADLARRAAANGVQEWQQRVIEGSPGRKVSADLLADAFPRLRMSKDQLAKEDARNVAAAKARAERQAAEEAREAERIAAGLGPTPPAPQPTGWHDFGPLPNREPGSRIIDQLMDQENAQWRAERARQLGGK